MMYTQNLYGNYRNPKFTDVFPDVDTFKNKYTQCGIPAKLADPNNVSLLYYLLYARYGNSTIASFDKNQFIYKVFSITFQYGPTWEKELQIQDEIRALNVGDESLEVGSTKIYNAAHNPDIAPSDQTLNELQFISDQNVSKTKRGKIEQYAMIQELLKTDVSELFLNKFKSLFLTIVNPEEPLYYVEEEE